MNQTIKPILLGSFVIVFIILAGVFFSNEDTDTFNIGPSIITLNEGDVFNLEIQNTGLFEDQMFNVTASDSSIVSVEGLEIKAMKPGSTILNATIEGSDEVITIQVKVLEVVKPVEQYEVVFENTTLDQISVEAGSTVELPSLNIEGYQFEGWLDEDGELVEELIQVNSDIRLTPVLNKLVESISITQPNNDLLVGSMIDLNVLLNPFDYDLVDLSFEVSNEDIATIDENGSVTFLEAGTVIVTVTDLITNISESVELVVTEPEETIFYTVSFDLGNGETLEPVLIEAGHRLNLSELPKNGNESLRHWILVRENTDDKIITNDSFIYRDMTLKAVWGPESLEGPTTIQTLSGNVTKEIVLSDNDYFTYEVLNLDGSFFAYGITKPSELQAMGMNLSFSAVLLNNITLPDPFSSYFYPRFEELGEVIEAIHNAGFQDMNRFDATQTNFLPIGHETQPFLGSFYGNGYTITNLQISTYNGFDSSNSTFNDLDDVGLFGFINNSSIDTNEFSYVSFEGAVIESDDDNVGILVGYASGNYARFGNIEFSINNEIIGFDDVGPLIGELNLSNVTISSITNHANASGESDIGGIIGVIMSDFVHLNNLINRGTIYGVSDDIGGISGNIDDSSYVSLFNLKNYGQITSDSDKAAGIVGDFLINDIVQAEDLFNYGTIIGVEQSGGIFGDFEVDNGVFINLINEGDVGENATSIQYIGGIVGDMSSSSNYVAFSGVINYGTIIGIKDIGGLFGQISGKDHYFEYLTNHGSVISEVEDIGGLVGSFDDGDVYRITFKHATNYADLILDAHNIGGIIGDIETSYDVIFEDIINHGMIQGSSDVGGLFGDLSIENLTASSLVNYGAVSGMDSGNQVGGIIGDLQDGRNLYFNQLVNDAPITGNIQVGGLFGKADSLSDGFVLENSTNYGEINGITNIGGLIGDINVSLAQFLDLTNDGTINAPNGNNIGGIIGNLTGRDNLLRNITSDALINGNSNTGGVVGQVLDSDISPINLTLLAEVVTVMIEDSTHSGSIMVETGSGIGGFIGYLYGGLVTDNLYGNTYINAPNSFQIGGLVGKLDGFGLELLDSTFDDDLNGIHQVGGLIGLFSRVTGTAVDLYISGHAISTNIQATGLDIGGYIGEFNDAVGELIIVFSEFTGGLIGIGSIGGFIGTMDGNLNVSSVLMDGYAHAGNSIDGYGNNVGGIIGDGSGTRYRIETYQFNGDLLGNSYIGGIAGQLDADLGLVMNTDLSGYVGATNFSLGGGFGYISGAAFLVLDVDLSSTIANITHPIVIQAGGLMGTASVNQLTLSSITSQLLSLPGGPFNAGFIGWLSGNVTIENSINYSTMGLSDTSGGFVGSFNEGSLHIINSENQGDITGFHKLGGFVGYVNTTGQITITNSTNSGMIVGNTEIGGFIGHIGESNLVQTISQSINTNSVGVDFSSDNTHFGGFVGLSESNLVVTSSINEGGVSGASHTGGIVGRQSKGSLTLSNLTNSGIINGYQNIGGIVGSAQSTALNTLFNLNNVNDIFGFDNNLGGLIGSINISQSGIIQNSSNLGDVSYQDLPTTSGTAVGGLVGLLKAETITFDNNTVNTIFIEGFDNVGGLAGFIDLTGSTGTVLTLTNNIIAGTIYANAASGRGEFYGNASFSGGFSQSGNDVTGAVLMNDPA